jgi:catechol 2,3-dioxygenase-like lactoylglutathione lyase family enzyme
MSILNHVCVGSSDRIKSAKFYDAALGALGVNNLGELGEMATLYGIDNPDFIILTPMDGNPATVGNGETIGFKAETRDAVHKFHEAGLAAGGTCEGAPGSRNFSPTAYGSYLRDPDGHKICAYCFADE